MKLTRPGTVTIDSSGRLHAEGFHFEQGPGEGEAAAALAVIEWARASLDEAEMAARRAGVAKVDLGLRPGLGLVKP